MAEETVKEDDDTPLFNGRDSGVRARVEHIVGLMTRLEWRKQMVRELSEEWGLSKSTVRDYSAEASRIVARSIPQGDDFKAGLIEMTLHIARNGLPKDAVLALRLLADLGGYLAPTKVKAEMSGPDGGPIQTRAVVVELPPLDTDKGD